MMGPSHRVAGVTAWLAVADLTRPGLLPVATGAIIAASVEIRVLPVGRGTRYYDPASVEITPRW